MSVQLQLLRLLLVFVVFPVSTALVCTESNLQRLAQAASLSYLPLNKMKSSPYFKSLGWEPIHQVVDPVSESGATIFNNNDHTWVIACRGSANPKNFGTNLQFQLVPATDLSQNDLPPQAMVHQGFRQAALGLWRQLGPVLLQLIPENEADVVFTGHSLGSATALLCAVHFQASVPWQQHQSIITFGGPKLCNGPLARHLRHVALEGWDILHLVHDKDPVLANNQKLWQRLGMENVGIEMSCDPQAPKVYTEARRKSGPAWNILDHCQYMGVFVGPRMV